MASSFEFSRSSRSFGALFWTGTAVLIILVLAFLLDAHPAIIILAAVLVAPAGWDIYRDLTAHITISDLGIEWALGQRKTAVKLAEIQSVNLKTAWDLSQRAKIRTSDGKTLRIPPPCLPSRRILDAQLLHRNIPHKRTIL